MEKINNLTCYARFIIITISLAGLETNHLKSSKKVLFICYQNKKLEYPIKTLHMF